jgi:hypothetical protein
MELPWTGTQDGAPAFLTRTREGTFLGFNPFSTELTNANMLVTGKTGSGKSFLAKQLLLQLQVLNPRIAIVTKGADYRALIELLGGQYREIGLSTKLVKNPWDLSHSRTGFRTGRRCGITRVPKKLSSLINQILAITQVDRKIVGEKISLAERSAA